MRSSSVESAILETLQEESGHLTAKEVLESIRPRLPAVNPSTIYRALERLAAAGHISVSDIGQGAVVYEIVHDEPHHHLVCQACGKIVKLEPEAVEAFLQGIGQKSGYQVTTNHLVLFGICPHCREKG